MAHIPTLTAQLAALAAAPPADLSEEDRISLFAAVNQARDAMMSPLDAVFRFSFGVYESTAVRLAIDMKIFDTAVPAGGSVTCAQLAEKAGADVQLVRRVMRMLSGISLFSETAPDTYLAKPLAGAFCTDSPIREAVIHLGSQASAVALLPDYFAKNGYMNPGDAFNGPWQFAQKTDKHYFEWLAEIPALQSAFNTVMGISRMGQVDWTEFYPVEERVKVDSAERIALVDVGGGVGHDLTALRAKMPNLTGRLVFEDLPIIVDAAQITLEGIVGIGHDFFNPQPESVRGAKAYYLRTVLHDWPDEQASTIIKNIKEVMAEDSILLINENMLPENGVSLYQAELDLAMMTCFSSLDRTEKQFRALLEDQGFECTGTFRPEVQIPGAGTVMEFRIGK